MNGKQIRSLAIICVIGFGLSACGGDGGGIPSLSVKNDSNRTTEFGRSVRDHIPGLPTTGHPDFGQPDSVVISGTVILQPDSQNGGSGARGTRAVVLAGGSIVGTTLTGEVLASGTTNENGQFVLEVPSNTENVIVTASQNNLTLKTVITRLPDENANIDAGTTAVTAFAENTIGTVGTNLNFDQLIDSLKSQENRQTSVLNQVSDISQGIIDDLLAASNNSVGRSISLSSNSVFGHNPHPRIPDPHTERNHLIRFGGEYGSGEIRFRSGCGRGGLPGNHQSGLDRQLGEINQKSGNGSVQF